jgi:hypothetical protein
LHLIGKVIEAELHDLRALRDVDEVSSRRTDHDQLFALSRIGSAAEILRLGRDSRVATAARSATVS